MVNGAVTEHEVILIHFKVECLVLVEGGTVLEAGVIERTLPEHVDEEGKVFSNEDSAAKGYDFQIFGHTFIKNPIITDAWACLDCMKAFILNDDGGITEC